MRSVKVLALGQRIVLVLALAGILSTIGSYSVSGPGPWSFFAPLAQGAYVVEASGWERLADAVVWIDLIVLWGIVSAWLLGPSPEQKKAKRCARGTTTPGGLLSATSPPTGTRHRGAKPPPGKPSQPGL